MDVRQLLNTESAQILSILVSIVPTTVGTAQDHTLLIMGKDTLSQKRPLAY